MCDSARETLRSLILTGALPPSLPRQGILSHHEVMMRLNLFDPDRGVKVAGHRGFFLMGDGVDLNQALINYGLDFLRKKGYVKVMTPFMMKKSVMAKTAQLDQFDEELYKVGEGSGSSGNAVAAGAGVNTSGEGDEDDKYLIATSEQPISAFHSDEWFDKPQDQLPVRYAGYSTCFRKEAVSGRGASRLNDDVAAAAALILT